MNKEITPVIAQFSPDEVKSFAMDSFLKEHPECTMKDLVALGISMDEAIAKNAEYCAAMDADPAAQTTPSMVTPVQFAQFWLTNPIKVLTRGRSLDKVVGRTIVGTWETEQIVATILERMGQPALYGDFTKAPLANWNVNFETRDNVRFEMGVSVGKLEEARASQMRLNSYALKREAMAEAFEILLNNIGWFGYNDGGKKVYGLLNDTNANAIDATTVQDWSAITGSTAFDTIVTEILAVITDRVSALNGNYDPEVDSATLVLPIDQYPSLGKVNSLGISVRDWLSKTYPKIRVIASAELKGAAGSVSGTTTGTDGVALFFVDKIAGDAVVQQMVTSTMRLVGAQPMAKGNYEVYSCSTAGTLLRYPLGWQAYEMKAS